MTLKKATRGKQPENATKSSVKLEMHFSYVSNVELLRELVEDGAVAGLVLLNNGSYQCDQAVPELKVVLPGPGFLRFSLRRLDRSRILKETSIQNRPADQRRQFMWKIEIQILESNLA